VAPTSTENYGVLVVGNYATVNKKHAMNDTGFISVLHHGIADSDQNAVCIEKHTSNTFNGFSAGTLYVVATSGVGFSMAFCKASRLRCL